jgi:hypothetical protein
MDHLALHKNALFRFLLEGAWHLNRGSNVLGNLN